MSADTLIRHVLAGHSGYVNILLTEEQAGKLGKEARYQQFHIGFLGPDNVPSYYCNKCNKSYENSPKIEVHIERFGGFKPEGAHTSVAYICGTCGEIVHAEALNSPEGIDVKYIVCDETGHFKPPTPEEIEDEMRKAEESAEKGKGNNLEHGHYEQELRQAQHWAGVIGYEISKERIDRLKTTYRKAYLEDMERNLPNIVKQIKQHAHGFRHQEPDEHKCETTVFEGSGLAGRFVPFFEALPHITIPDDPELRKDILRILNAYRDMPIQAIEELEEQRKKVEERLKSQQAYLEAINGDIVLYCERARLSMDAITEVSENPLSTYPGDYDDEGDNIPF